MPPLLHAFSWLPFFNIILYVRGQCHTTKRRRTTFKLTVKETRCAVRGLIRNFIPASVWSPWCLGPVTMAWQFLRLRMEGRPPVWKVIENILNKQFRTADKGWSSRLGVGRGANNSSLQKPVLLRNGYMCRGSGLIIWYDLSNAKRTRDLVRGMLAACLSQGHLR